MQRLLNPDRLMVRVARKFDEPGENDTEVVQSLCARLAVDSDECVGTVDVILWFAASKGFIDGIILRGGPTALSRFAADSAAPNLAARATGC